MTESSLNPVQAAVYAVLSADNGAGSLAALGFPVLDGVPEQTKLRKYVLLGESIEQSQDTFGQYGNEELLTIHVFAEDTQNQSGWKAVKTADARIVELLDGQPLAVTGRSFIYCNRDQGQTILEPAPWRHLARDFRIATEEP